jgi:CheY-like chemotaxis protein
MLIDDNEIDNFIATEILNGIDFSEKVISMNSAVAALEYLKNTPIDSDGFPDTIFLDIRMPVMDGFDFLNQFLKLSDSTRAKCDVVMLTSSSDPMDITRALQYPVVRKFLSKPLSETLLKDLINLLNSVGGK